MNKPKTSPERSAVRKRLVGRVVSHQLTEENLTMHLRCYCDATFAEADQIIGTQRNGRSKPGLSRSLVRLKRQIEKKRPLTLGNL